MNIITTEIEEPFVGRQKEMKWLKHHFDEVLNYNGRFVLIQGETGIGKTKLLTKFHHSIESQGIHILTGRSVMNDVKPFSPFSRMIEDHLENIEYSTAWLIKFIEPEIAPYFIHLLPRLKNHYPLEIPHFEEPIDNPLVFYAFERFFENLSKSKPLILFLDDIMWMGAESVELLKYLVPRITSRAILIIAATHSFKNNPVLHSTLDELNGARLVHTINLDNFSQNEIEDLLNQKFKNKMPSRFMRWLFTITKGNPLFVQEIINTLIHQNIINYDVDKNEWLIEDDYEDFPISATVESVINYRLGHLAISESQLLQTAAIIGERFNLKILHKLLGSVSKKQFLRSCNILSAAKLIDGSGDTRQFSHPLIRELLYQRIDINKRRVIHRRLAAMLKEHQGNDEEIAYHITVDLAPTEETKKLVRYLFNIAKNFFDNYNYPLAWKYLKIVQRIAEKISLLDKERMKIKAEYNYLSWRSGREVAPLEEMEKLARELEKEGLKNEAARHYHMLFDRAMTVQNLKTAEKYLAKGISLANKKKGIYWTLVVERCLLKRRKGLLEEAVQEANRFINEIPPSENPTAFYKAVNSLGMVSIMRGDFKSAHQSVSQALRIAEEYHLLPYLDDAHRNLGLIEMQIGRIDSALVRLNNALKEAEIFQRGHSIAIALIYIGFCHFHKGSFEKAIEFFDRAMTQGEKINNPRVKAVAQLGKARTWLEMDKIEEAERLINVMVPGSLEKGARCDLDIIKSIIYLAKCDFDHAEDLIDKALNLTKNFKFEMHYARVLGLKALLLLQKQKRDEALNYLEKAKTELSTMGAMPHLATLLIDFGMNLGGEQGETIVLDGLKMLVDMQATEKIAQLCKVLKKKRFNRALKFAQEKIFQGEIEKIEISTFGGLSIKKPGEIDFIAEKAWPSRKAKDLLSLILVLSSSGGVTREILASYLWPEITKKKSQANFRVALTHLNKILGNKAVIQKGQFLLFDREQVSADFWRFDELVRDWQYLKQSGKFHPAEDRVRKAIALYKGDFLPEFYSQPIIDRQLELKDTMKELLFWLASRCMERIEWQEAIFFARRLLTIDLNDERAFQIIMEGLYNQGDRAGAIRLFESLKKRLKQELNTEPSPETLKLHKKITAIE